MIHITYKTKKPYFFITLGVKQYVLKTEASHKPQQTQMCAHRANNSNSNQ